MGRARYAARWQAAIRPPQVNDGAVCREPVLLEAAQPTRIAVSGPWRLPPAPCAVDDERRPSSGRARGESCRRGRLRILPLGKRTARGATRVPVPRRTLLVGGGPKYGGDRFRCLSRPGVRVLIELARLRALRQCGSRRAPVVSERPVARGYGAVLLRRMLDGVPRFRRASDRCRRY